MEVYKLGKTIKNQEIEINLILHQLNQAREDLKKYLKRRKEISIEENDTEYKEMDTTKLFGNGNSKEFDAPVADLMEKNRAQAEEIMNLKLDQELQAILLCEVTEQKKKAMEEKAMIEEDKRVFANRLEEKSLELTKISNMQLDILSQMMNANYDLNVEDIEITTLKLQNEKL